MKPLPLTRELLRLAERLLPGRRPQDALDHPQEFLAHVAEFGNQEDIALLVDYVGEDALREALAAQRVANV